MSNEVDNPRRDDADMGMIAYIAYLVGIFPAFTIIAVLVGLFVSYSQRGKVEGLWLESHYTWLIRTFWFGIALSLLAAIVSVITLMLLSWVAFVAVWVWYLVRVINGFRAFQKKIPLADPESPLFG